MEEEICVDSELSERYEGEAERLAKVVLIIRNETEEQDAYALADAVINMLTNGCFCPSCMMAQLVSGGL